MKTLLISFEIKKAIGIISLIFASAIICGSSVWAASPPEDVQAIYLPPHRVTYRSATELIHYANTLPLNAVVLHVKDPYGRIYWKSATPLADEIKSSFKQKSFKNIVKKYKNAGIWTIAKIDVFADHLLVEKRPDLGIVDVETGRPWADKNDLYWANPYNEKVWEYIIGLSKELASFGFDEIQFDYIRFPSDGNLSAIHYPYRDPSVTRAQCIGTFLKKAYKELKPLDVSLSIDVFGLIAWKTKDFGIGQVLEAMAPHVDVICPMFYPSHFPIGFLGKQDPGKYPLEIMERSTRRIKQRTNRIIRPWIQGFWYNQDQINSQLDGVYNTDTHGWSVWNPAGNYRLTYSALAKRFNKTLGEPEFYPSMAELRKKDDRVTKGNFRVVNLTCYNKGFSILSLEEPRKGFRSAYSNPNALLDTLDEGIMDRILNKRNVSFNKMTPKYVKKSLLSGMLCEDLQISARRLRPKPIYINWDDGCEFSLEVPEPLLNQYKHTEKIAFTPTTDHYVSTYAKETMILPD